MADDTWCIILAGGEGKRLHPITRALYGHPLPKQFASIVGDRTMLQETVDRFSDFAPPARTVVVVAEPWEAVARQQLAHQPALEIVVQPADRGTGPGLLLPLARIRAQASEGAQIVVTPSDHHFRSPERLGAALMAASAASREHPEQLVLLGAAPDGPCSDLGWIVPCAGSLDGGQAQRVARFVEKPPVQLARRLRRQGALWNTFVMLGSAGAFWDQAAWHLPEQTTGFEKYAAAIGTPGEPELLRTLYGSLKSADFSRDVLQRTNALRVVRLEESGWCDWGTPERLLDNLREAGHLPALERRISAARSGPARGDLAV